MEVQPILTNLGAQNLQMIPVFEWYFYPECAIKSQSMINRKFQSSKNIKFQNFPNKKEKAQDGIQQQLQFGRFETQSNKQDSDKFSEEQYMEMDSNSDRNQMNQDNYYEFEEEEKSGRGFLDNSQDMGSYSNTPRSDLQIYGTPQSKIGKHVIISTTNSNAPDSNIKSQKA
eukprot:403336675